MSERKYYYSGTLPPEILLNLLRLMSPETATKCRQLSKQFRDVVDDFLCHEDSYWVEAGRNKFKTDFDKAATKTLKEMRKCDIYKSLSLWGKLADAEYVVSAQNFSMEHPFLNLRLISEGLVGVQSQDNIKYLSLFSPDIKCMSICGTSSFGRFLRYSENGLILALLTTEHAVVGSSKREATLSSKILLKEVRDFMLYENYLYVIGHDDSVYLCQLDPETNEFEQKITFSTPEPIRCWGVKDKVFHVMTTVNHLYRVSLDKRTVELQAAEIIDLNLYIDYGFLNNSVMSYRNMWPNYSNYLRDSMSVFSYCGLLFLGSRVGTVDVYPLHRENGGGLGQLIRTFSVVPSLGQETLYPVVAMEAVEQYSGHKLVVLTPRCVFTVELNHFLESRKETLRRRGEMVRASERVS